MTADHNQDLAASARVEDLPVRLVLSPIFGVAVASFSGLVDHARHSNAGLLATYGLFAVVAFLIWEGNRRLYFGASRREDWLERPWHRAGLLLSIVLAFTIPVSTAFLLAWQAVTGDPGLRPHAVPMAVVTIVAIATLITYIYETVFLIRDWESARLRSARAESARLAMELDRLTREVDAHFLFNNLHALQQLVERGDARAVPFLEALAQTYRYIVASRDETLVPLATELEALERHHTLAAIRYGGAVRVIVDVPADAMPRLLVPPLGLVELLQNALKHNLVDADRPLTLTVRLDGSTLVVDNPVTPQAGRTSSTGVGLSNLAERVRLAVGRDMTWTNDGGRFVVRVPVRPAAQPTDS